MRREQSLFVKAGKLIDTRRKKAGLSRILIIVSSSVAMSHSLLLRSPVREILGKVSQRLDSGAIRSQIMLNLKKKMEKQSLKDVPKMHSLSVKLLQLRV